MIVNAIVSDESKQFRARQWRSPQRCYLPSFPDKLSISKLAAEAINQMSCAELVLLIRDAGLPGPFGPELERRLPFYDRTALLRLAHLAKRCCQNRESNYLEKSLDESYF